MACTRKLCDEAARRPATCVAATEEPDWNDINDDEGYFGPDKCVYGDRECSDCNCASCNLCVDNYGTRGSFYTTSASQMTMNQPCWTYLRDEGYTTQNNPAGTRDAYMWRTNGESGPENKTCKWVGKDAVNRCAMKGVMIEGAIGSSTPYYMPGEQIGLAWLFANQPAYLASDACPLACCVDDPYWTYARDDGVHDCAHVAELPSKRCDREDFDTGTFARDKCPAACGACISTDDICQDDIFWHHTYRSYQHCGWVKESPKERCNVKGEDGVKAKRACPLACGGCDQCVDDPSYEYQPGKDCKHVAELPEKRCARNYGRGLLCYLQGLQGRDVRNRRRCQWRWHLRPVVYCARHRGAHGRGRRDLQPQGLRRRREGAAPPPSLHLRSRRLGRDPVTLRPIPPPFS